MFIIYIELTDPVGWVNIPIVRQPSMNDDINYASSTVLRTFIIQIKFHSMHQNGRDCHLRGVKLFGPCNSELAPVSMNIPIHSNNISNNKSQQNSTTKGRNNDIVFKLNSKLPFTNAIGVIR